MPTCFLTDNGSLRASSTLNLRRIAAELEQRISQPVVPVSLLHSDAVEPAELDGQPAELLDAALARTFETGEEVAVVVPLFFGPSRALTSFLPRRLKRIKTIFPKVTIRVAPSLFDPLDGTDLRLARILHDRVEEVCRPGKRPPVILVDHGSPAPAVTYVRNFIAGQLSALLAGRVSRVVAASMERRPGDQYRFSGPLLEEVLQQEGFARGKVVVAMLFLSPGRHAGENGDVWKICQERQGKNPALQVTMTGLVGDHPALVEILADRFQQALRQGGGRQVF